MDLGKLVDHNPGEPIGPKVVDGHTEKEYQKLHRYLVQKYKKLEEEAELIDKETLQEQERMKYLTLRNEMIVDLLQYIDDRETLEPLSKQSDADQKVRLGQVANSDPKLAELLAPLLTDATVQTLTNTELNHAIYELEHNPMPDLFREQDYAEMFSKIKRNQFYTHEATTYADAATRTRTPSAAAAGSAKSPDESDFSMVED